MFRSTLLFVLLAATVPAMAYKKKNCGDILKSPGQFRTQDNISYSITFKLELSEAERLGTVEYLRELSTTFGTGEVVYRRGTGTAIVNLTTYGADQARQLAQIRSVEPIVKQSIRTPIDRGEYIIVLNELSYDGALACVERVKGIAHREGPKDFSYLSAIGMIAAVLTPDALDEIRTLNCIKFVEKADQEYRAIGRVGREN